MVGVVGQWPIHKLSYVLFLLHYRRKKGTGESKGQAHMEVYPI